MGKTVVASVLLVAGLAANAHAQTTDRRPWRVTFGGGLAIATAHGAETDPPRGYIRPAFHKTSEWPVAAGLVAVTTPLGGAWRLATEATLPVPAYSKVVEESFTHSESSTVVARYRHAEQLVSLLAGPQVSLGRAAIEFRGGVTVTRTSQALTNRIGVLSYYAGTVMIRRPDLEHDEWAVGITGGADLVVPVGERLAWTITGRVHRFARDRDNDLPALEPYIVVVGGGLRWNVRRN